MSINYLDQDQLARFDELFLDYGVRMRILVEDCPALRLLYRNMSQLGLDSQQLERRLALAFEIKLVLLNVYYELAEVAGLENRHMVNEEDRRRYRPLESIESFSAAIRRARAAFALATRMRALWDKLFLYVTLTVGGERTLQRLQNQKSKRRFFFREFSNGFGPVSSALMSQAKADLERLEGNFRTPELHGFGSIRGWVFDTPDHWDSTDCWALLGHYSQLSKFIHQVFAESSSSRCSFDAM
jgi:hypothetical protein